MVSRRIKLETARCATVGGEQWHKIIVRLLLNTDFRIFLFEDASRSIVAVHLFAIHELSRKECIARL